jgi:hypothetical protein
MRARRRHFLGVLFASVSVALSSAPAHSVIPASAGQVALHTCPSGTAWDNFLNRCV